MKNKNGFTLVELLAVIAILAILVIISLPNVLEMFNNAKKDIFLTETKTVIKKTSDKYISEVMKGNKIDHINSLDETKLNLSNNNLKYDIKLDNKGNVLSYVISDNNFCLESTKNIYDVTADDVTNGSCDSVGDLNSILGREELKKGTYFTDKVLSDNVIQSDNDIDFTIKNYNGDKYTLNMDSDQIEYSIKNIVYYYGNNLYLHPESGKLSPLGGSSSNDIISAYNSGNIVFCENSDSCDIMYKIDSVKSNSVLLVKRITTIPNQRTSNGNGLFYNGNGNSKIYYFRGDVGNNYIKFADIMWRIVRFNDDYSIRIISDTGVTKSAFNTSVGDNAYVGYMYGNAGSNNYNSTHKNLNDSTVKTVLDDMYKKFEKDYSSYLIDAGFCADRTLADPSYTKFDSTAYGITDEASKVIDTGLGYGNNFTLYSAFYKYQEKLKPSFKCNKNDFYTVSNKKGNTALKYPIGLLSVDEAIFAGAQFNSLNTSYYLYNESVPWWLMDAGGNYNNPEDLNNITTIVSAGSQGVYGQDVRSELSVRPVINLKNNVVYKSGKGTYSDPYQIELK